MRLRLLGLFELASVFVRFNHIARVIKNLNDSIKAEATDLPGNQKRFWRGTGVLILSRERIAC